MRPSSFLLRFEDRPQAVSMLSGLEFQAVAGDGILQRPTGETVEFEGEAMSLTSPVSGYHVELTWCGALPVTLKPYLVSRYSH